MLFEYASVYLLDAPVFLDNAYDYYLPAELRDKVFKGSFVNVPFGNSNRAALAVVTELREYPLAEDITCKPISSVCNGRLKLSDELMSLCFFMREQTLCTFGEAVRAAVPASAISKLEAVYSAADRGNDNFKATDDMALPICEYIRKKGSVSFSYLKDKLGPVTEPLLKKLCDSGALTRTFVVKEPSAKTENLYSLRISKEDALAIADGSDTKYRLRSPMHIELVRYLNEQSEAVREEEIISELGASRAQIKALCDKGIVRRSKKDIDRSSIDEYISEPKKIEMNPEQEAALGALSALVDTGQPRAALLYGVTGSGKTCVMMKLIDKVLGMGRGVIVLLPEISLTPQTLGLFCSRYGDRVAVIHSALSAGERYDTFNKISDGRADVVIGTRSAVFAPLKALGLIIIDEEQEHTYKSDMNPKYHARDIARYRCNYNNALMLLASATPSLESFKKAEDGKYTLIRLTERYGGAKLPKVTVCDMRAEAQGGNTSPLGTLLCKRLVENYESGGQSVLFLNRRGYNNFISCRACGEAVKCPVCSVSMTYHTIGRSYESGELRCHWCGRRAELPKECPSCKSPHLVRMGYGTQRVEEELSSLLPKARILRLDTDTASSKYAYDELLGSFRRHEADILLGTQMVTKGHDFPDVTLVGVLLADSSLYLDDYRANERTFSMLTQVIGRAGRAKRLGEAIIQTNNPDHECIRLSSKQDFESFYKSEIRLRKLLVFPPYCDIALLSLSSSEEKEVLKASTLLSETLRGLLAKDYSDVPFVFYGPFEAPVYKVDGKYRMRMIAKCRLNKRSRALFGEVLSKFTRSGAKGITFSVDFNPSNI